MTSGIPATDAEKRAFLIAGRNIAFPAPDSGAIETPAERAARTIQASWLQELPTAANRVIDAPIMIKNAIVEGPLDLRFATFNREVQLRYCEFLGEVDFSFSSFQKGVALTGSTFSKTAFFSGCQSRYTFKIEGAFFAEEASFLDLYVDGILVAAGARFAKVTFERARITKSAFFRAVWYKKKLSTTRFAGEARFLDAQFEGRAEFDGAQFMGFADFSYVKVGGTALFRATLIEPTDADGWPVLLPIRFWKGVSFRSARFLGVADFRGSQFEQAASFRNMSASAELHCHNAVFGEAFCRTVFADEADFGGLQVEGTAVFDGVSFRGPANFTRSHFKADVSFNTFVAEGRLHQAEFRAPADFSDSHVEGNFGGEGIRFYAAATLSRVRIDGNAHFQPVPDGKKVVTARFAGPTTFIKLNIQGSLEAELAQFEGEVSFELAQVAGIVLLRAGLVEDEIKSPRFAGKANFLEARFHGADFAGAQFEGPTIFARTSFDGPVFFRAFRSGGRARSTRFASYVDFVETKAKGRAEFTETEFAGYADFSRIEMLASSTFAGAHFADQASFNGARFAQTVSFEDTTFIGRADLSRMKVEGSALFQRADFSNKVDLRDSYIVSCFFRDELIEGKDEQRRAEFTTAVDLRGFNYERIHAGWERILDAMDPDDRQPYVTLEKYFRTSGHDRQAELVYLKRRHAERRRLASLSQRLGYLSQWLQWFLFNYGVRPFRLLGFSLGIVLLGLFMFSRPGAVVDKESKSSAAPASERLAGSSAQTASGRSETNQVTGVQATQPVDLNWTQALGVSLRLFIPIVEIPSGSRWAPSENQAPLFRYANLSFAGYATLHRIAGAILVPLGIAALTGLLYRKDK
jgi:uncharacterized protein YjbI with pentapeptide repeats